MDKLNQKSQRIGFDELTCANITAAIRTGVGFSLTDRNTRAWELLKEIVARDKSLHDPRDSPEKSKEIADLSFFALVVAESFETAAKVYEEECNEP